MAEQTVEAVLKHESTAERAKYSRSQTLSPLNPKVTVALLARAKAMAPRWAEDFSVPEPVVAALCERHGMEAHDILSRYLPEVTSKAESDFDLLYGLEALHAIDQTMCLHLKDFVFRRTHLFLAESDHGAEEWDFVSRVMATRLRWSEQERIDQINALQKQILFELHWRH